MGFLANLKGNKAYALHGKKHYKEALALYEEAVKDGMDIPRNLLAYSSLLVRMGEYQKARELIVKIQKYPGMNAEQKSQLFCNYAAAVSRLGEPEKGISVLERQAAKNPTGLVYETLGYLYVLKLEHQPDPSEPAPVPEAPAEEEKSADEDSESAEDTAEENEEQEEAEPILTPYEQWQKDVEKARKFLDEALEYDDEDSICVDNLAQFHYRVLHDHETALTYFKKANEIKDTQIDTLWFLSRYDLQNNDTAAAIKKLETALGGRFSALNYVTQDEVKQEIRRLGGKVDED